MSSKKRHGLGKGMNALIKSNDIEIVEALETADKMGVQEIDMTNIDVNPDQPRKVFVTDDIEGLARTIDEHGLINPITLREKNGRYQIISGERRFRALKFLNRTKAPALILNVQDSKMLELTLIENIQREDLNAIEIAYSYKKLIDDLDIKQEDLANRVGKSRSTITNSMRILDLSDNIKSYIVEGKITEGHARSILSFSDKDAREKLALEIIENSYSVRKVEEIVRNSKLDKKEIIENIKKVVKKDPNLRNIENRLEKIFSTRVLLHDKEGQAGRIVIEYFSPDDLERIMEIMEACDEHKENRRSNTRTEINY
jgi:ParB family chromosome partitioning protein